MKVKFIFPLLCLQFFLNEYVQAQQLDSFKKRKNSCIISYNPFPIAIKQFTLGVEYFHKENKSLSAEGGFALAMYDSYRYFPLFVKNSVIFRLSNSLTRESKNSNRYLQFHSFGLSYRRIWSDMVTLMALSTDDADKHYKWKGYSFGPHYQFGFRVIGKRLTLNPFVLGAITLKYTQTTYLGTSWRYDGVYTYFPDNKQSSSFSPSIDFEVGARIGFRFKRKEEEASRD